MSFKIPEIPDALSANNTAGYPSAYNLYGRGLRIMAECVDKLKAGVFPCHVKLPDSDKDNLYLEKICDNLKTAGYQAKIVFEEIEKYHHDGNYVDSFWAIRIDNPLQK